MITENDFRISSRDQYFEWLISLIKGEPYYVSLIQTLYSIPYNAPIESLDHNRRLAGIRLRDRFRVETKRRYPISVKGCTFLEMMIALAIDMDDKILYESRFGDRYLDWFWNMIDNAGWSTFTDSEWSTDKAHIVIDRCHAIMNHEYNSKGEGGLFPVYRHPEADMADIDLWKQAFWWIDENLKSGRIK